MAIAAAALMTTVVIPVPRASAFTLIDLQKLALILDGVHVFATLPPCGGGERVDFDGALRIRYLVHADGSFGYTLNAPDAVGQGALTGATYRLAGALSGETRPGATLAADLLLVGRSRAPIPIEVRVRTTVDASGKPQGSLASLGPVRPCDPGTLVVGDEGVVGPDVYKLVVGGTGLEPGSSVVLYGVTARGSAVTTEKLDAWPVDPNGTTGNFEFAHCSWDATVMYATGTSASGQPVTSNTYIPLC